MGSGNRRAEGKYGRKGGAVMAKRTKVSVRDGGAEGAEWTAGIHTVHGARYLTKRLRNIWKR